MDRVKNILKSQEGAALILVLFLITIIAIGTSALLFNSFYSSENSVYGERKLEATQRAKGGIEEGLDYVERTYQQTGTVNNHTIQRLDDDWYDVVITAGNNSFSVQSTSKYMTVNGNKDVVYIVNGIFSSGYGGLNSTFFENSVVTANNSGNNGNNGNDTTFHANNFNDINIEGNFLGNYNINNYDEFIIDENKVFSPLTFAEFTSEYNNLKTQVDNLYPFPETLSGRERIYSDQVFNDDIERDKIEFNNGSGTIVFKGDVYADEIKINNGNYNIIFEGIVYVKKLSISNISGSVYFMDNLIVEGKFDIGNTNINFQVDGIVLTEDYKYNNNNSTSYSVPYIVARDKIDINNINDINSGGLASPDISINNVHDVNINSSGGGGSTGSYLITDWNVQY